MVTESLQLRAQGLDPAGVLVGGGVEGQSDPQLPGEGVGQATGFGQGHRERAGAVTPGGVQGHRVETGVEATPDEHREPLALGRTDPPTVPGREQQVVPIAHGLPQRHRQGQVTGEFGPPFGGEGGLVELVQFLTAREHPLTEISQICLGDRGVQLLPHAPRRLGRENGAARHDAHPRP